MNKRRGTEFPGPELELAVHEIWTDPVIDDAVELVVLRGALALCDDDTTQESDCTAAGRLPPRFRWRM